MCIFPLIESSDLRQFPLTPNQSFDELFNNLLVFTAAYTSYTSSATAPLVVLIVRQQGAV